MTIVYQTDKRFGITYAYESKSNWDTETKMPRCKRTLIRRINSESDEIKPTDGSCRKKQPIVKGCIHWHGKNHGSIIGNEVSKLKKKS